MNYKVYKLQFQTAVHFGNGVLENSECTFCADMLFSALCIEALKMENKVFQEFYSYAKNGDILLSDAFPYMGETYFLPKPMKHIEHEVETGNSILKKAYKKLKYIPVEDMDKYLKGEYDVLNAPDMNTFGKAVMRVSASIRGEDETKPYQIGTFYFYEGNGLYIIVGYQEKEQLRLVENLLKSLSFCGLGGKRSNGLGRFSLYTGKLHMELEKRIQNNGQKYMLLSMALPTEQELPKVIEESEYILIKRSGFVASENYAKEQMRKRDLYAFKSGSCFGEKFSGDIYDVSDGKGTHPVYCYAKPMFMEVSI